MLVLLRHAVRVASAGLALVAVGTPATAMDDAGRQRFRQTVEPILADRCYDCHGHGASEAGVALDGGESGDPPLDDPQLWQRALRQLRAGLMPPDGDALEGAELAALERWIVRDALQFDPERPDPGRVTIRRLNRTEYRNTVRDLLGVDFNAADAFPPDDTGHGFDTLGEVLTTSPLLLEKYVEAAGDVVAAAAEQARRSQPVPTDDQPKADAPPPDPFVAWHAVDGAAYFADADLPADQRRKRAAQALTHFASRAFRRPVDDATVARLVALAEAQWSEGEQFAAGLTRAMAAVLASPRFLFRIEEIEPAPGEDHPLVDQFALASRLSYFLWSTMPDAALLELAAQGRLRAELPAQLERMLADGRSEQFYRNFVGQWLQTRDVESVPIDPAFVSLRDDPRFAEFDVKRNRFRQLRRRSERQDRLTKAERSELAALRKEMNDFRAKFGDQQFSYELRESMREETERHFEYVVVENRPLVELLDANYAFLNQGLARHYGLESLVERLPTDGVRRIELPAGSPRGGVLTQGSLLTVTSNPDRTSPVKRGQFILENILGTPAAPPPANVPPLDSEAAGADGRPLTVRESMELHRADPTCRSCHARMDPLGLALENFNAMGAWRDTERGEPIDSSATMASGEQLAGAADLKRALAQGHRREFLVCLTEKLLTYGLGRGLEYHDVGTVDAIVDRIEAEGGTARALLTGVVQSAPFQRRRADVETTVAATPTP
ncbi:MAG: DUF1592 domain-containing protein [Pirellulales bacterium]|nr:DUF1592 domain-containing protein [Pirellulales bacterium]